MANEVTVPAGTAVHCNACDKRFWTTREMTRGTFCGNAAARLNQFTQCPYCMRMDAHWIFADDIMPSTVGNFEARKTTARQWRAMN